MRTTPSDRPVFRVLDVNFNRCREALRVLEDSCRFHHVDADLAMECKRMRQVLSLLARPYGARFMEARDSDRDVGRDFDRAGKPPRDVAGMIQANVRRLQEALRSIEEHSRTIDPKLSREVYQLRFRSYPMEKIFFRFTEVRSMLDAARVYVLVSSHLARHPLERVVREAVKGGADIVQLREEGITDRQLSERARRVRKIIGDRALFIVNNRADVAAAVEADGVHLGRRDLSISSARSLLGSGRIIGATTHDLGEARRAIREGADYVSIGPVYPSPTKPGLRPAGLAYVRRAAREVAIPWFAIGGIRPENISQLRQAGCRRVAVSSAAIGEEDVTRAVQRLKRALTGKEE